MITDTIHTYELIVEEGGSGMCTNNIIIKNASVILKFLISFNYLRFIMSLK